MNNKRVINILIISSIILFIIVYLFNPYCLFKKVFSIPCPICGMTKAFKYILKGKVLKALEMNLLSIPLFIFIIIFYIVYIISLCFKKYYIYKLYDEVVKYYKVIIVILIVNWVINIVKFLY